MRRVWPALVFVLLACPAPGTAGGLSSRPPSSASTAPVQRPDIFVGYTWTKAGEAGLNGWNLAGGYPLGRSLRVVVDLAGHYGSFAQADLSQFYRPGE
jgi:hypothetical protein